jgi:hypothetical protein
MSGIAQSKLEDIISSKGINRDFLVTVLGIIMAIPLTSIFELFGDLINCQINLQPWEYISYLCFHIMLSMHFIWVLWRRMGDAEDFHGRQFVLISIYPICLAISSIMVVPNLELLMMQSGADKPNNINLTGFWEANYHTSFLILAFGIFGWMMQVYKVEVPQRIDSIRNLKYPGLKKEEKAELCNLLENCATRVCGLRFVWIIIWFILAAVPKGSNGLWWPILLLIAFLIFPTITWLMSRMEKKLKARINLYDTLALQRSRTGIHRLPAL